MIPTLALTLIPSLRLSQYGRTRLTSRKTFTKTLAPQATLTLKAIFRPALMEKTMRITVLVPPISFNGSRIDGSGKLARYRSHAVLQMLTHFRYCLKRTRTSNIQDRDYWKDAKTAFRIASQRDLYKFFNWWLKQTRGKNGRRLRGTKCASSLGTDWKLFRLVHQQAQERRLTGN